MITRIAVITAKSLTKLSLAQRIRMNTSARPTVRLSHQEGERAEHALARALQTIDVTLQRQAEDDRR